MIWYTRRITGSALVAVILLAGLTPPIAASDRTTFRGCVVERTDSSILLHTSADERVTIDTSWIAPAALDAALADCVTVATVTVDGRFMAESIEGGDEPNEVNSITNETTADREQRARERRERDEKDADEKKKKD